MTKILLTKDLARLRRAALTRARKAAGKDLLDALMGGACNLTAQEIVARVNKARIALRARDASILSAKSPAQINRA